MHAANDETTTPRSPAHHAWRVPAVALAGVMAASACGGGGDADADAAPPGADTGVQPDADPGAVPRGEAAACRFRVPDSLGPEGVAHVCGDLIVYEDRAHPEGRRLRLHYVQIFGAGGDAPVIYLDGGPGGNGGTILAYLAYLGPDFVDGLLAQGDFLVIAQRGTTLSEPSLACEEPWPHDCAERLSRSVDLTAFSTAANADDVDDLRAALGYEALRLYGISYGSRLALEILRRHGERVDAAVAGGTVPAQVVWPAEIPASYHGALTALSDLCAADAGCAEAYGDLVVALADGIGRLDTSPVIFDYRGTPIDIDGATYASLVFRLMYGRSTYPMLPLLITELGEGRTAQVADFLTAIFDAYGEGDLSVGLYYSVVCGEIFNPPDENAFDQANGAVPAPIRDAMASSWFGLEWVCRDWPRGALQAALAEPVVSPVPTLVANGAVDPITPPRFGDIAAATLSGADVVVFADGGHGATLQTPCGNQVLLSFLAAPGAALDTGCAGEVTVSFALPSQSTVRAAPPQVLAHELSLAPLPPHVDAPLRRALRAARAAADR